MYLQETGHLPVTWKEVLTGLGCAENKRDFLKYFFLQKLVLCEGFWLTPLGCGDVNSLEQLLFSVERNRDFLKSGDVLPLSSNCCGLEQ